MMGVRRNRVFRVASAPVLVCASVVMGGCQSTGDSGGRLAISDTTKADRNSSYISMPEMYAATDRVVEALAYELVDIPDIRDRDSKTVLELGQVANHTATPTSDFNLIRQRLVSRLKNSQVIRSKIMFVSSLSRVDAELQRLEGGGGDLLQEGSGSRARQYNPQDMYILLCDFYEANRGSRRYYFYEFKLVNPVTREEVFTRSFDLSQH